MDYNELKKLSEMSQSKQNDEARKLYDDLPEKHKVGATASIVLNATAYIQNELEKDSPDKELIYALTSSVDKTILDLVEAFDVPHILILNSISKANDDIRKMSKVNKDNAND